MLFALTAEYSHDAIKGMIDGGTSRREAIGNLLEAAGGKLQEYYTTWNDGPGTLCILDIPPERLPTLIAVVAETGRVRNLQARRLLTENELGQVRQGVKELRSHYKHPGN